MDGGQDPRPGGSHSQEREKRYLAVLSGDEQGTASRRCFDLRPEGPGAEPGQKDMTHLRTVDSASLGGRGTRLGNEASGPLEWDLGDVCSEFRLG